MSWVLTPARLVIIIVYVLSGKYKGEPAEEKGHHTSGGGHSFTKAASVRFSSDSGSWSSIL